MTTKDNTTHKGGKRLLPFRRVANFRDLGGYPAADGRTVRWGALYRSGHLAKMHKHDLQLFSSLGIDTVIDLRSEDERKHDPNCLPENNHPKVLELSILDEANDYMRREIRSRIDARKYDDLNSAVMMRNAYRQFAVDFLPKFRQVVHTVLEADGRPVLWHCTAGKDRTGFAAAILLRLLGVDHEIAMKDYLLSNWHVDLRQGQMILLRLLKGKGAVELVQPLLTVREEWLAGSFQAIDEQWGDFNHYAAEGLELSTADIERLRNNLLE